MATIDPPTTYLLIPNSAQPKRNINYAILIYVSWLKGRATVNNNYIDPAGVAGNWIIHNAISRGRLNKVVVSGSGNRNMLSGAECSISGVAVGRAGERRSRGCGQKTVPAKFFKACYLISLSEGAGSEWSLIKKYHGTEIHGRAVKPTAISRLLIYKKALADR